MDFEDEGQNVENNVNGTEDFCASCFTFMTPEDFMFFAVALCLPNKY
jgi:hypothetical protein